MLNIACRLTTLHKKLHSSSAADLNAIASSVAVIPIREATGDRRSKIRTCEPSRWAEKVEGRGIVSHWLPFTIAYFPGRACRAPLPLTTQSEASEGRCDGLTTKSRLRSTFQQINNQGTGASARIGVAAWRISVRD